MRGCVSAVVLGDPFSAEGVFVVADSWSYRFGELHNNGLAIVRGCEDLSVRNVVALHRQVGRECSHILHKHGCCGVNDLDGLHTRIGGVAALVCGGEGAHQGVGLGAIACQRVHGDGDVDRAAASVGGCGYVQRAGVAAVGHQILWEEVPAWGCGVHNGDGLDLDCGVAAIVRGSECPHNAVRARAIARHFRAVFRNGNVCIGGAVVRRCGNWEHLVSAFHRHVSREVLEFWRHLVHQGDELDECFHVSTSVGRSVHACKLPHGLHTSAGCFVGFPSQFKGTVRLACRDV